MASLDKLPYFHIYSCYYAVSLLGYTESYYVYI